jgi:MYXO-CTERM domain-containing protein
MGHDLVTILVSGFFQSVKLRSDSQNAFEFTNFTASCEECAPGETPIPGALPLFMGGLATIGFLARRRKVKTLAA